MVTTQSMPRVPFATLGSSRLGRLSSVKNCQNGEVLKASTGKAGLGKASLKTPVNTTKLAPVNPAVDSLKSSGKRSFDFSIFEDVDSENLDPETVASPAKKSKITSSAFTFSLSSNSNTSNTMAPPPVPKRILTPMSPRKPSTAPAGRSPKGSRRLSKGIKSINPPFGIQDTSLPFSLDEALRGALDPRPAPGTASAEPAPTTKPSYSIPEKEPMSKSLIFEIYQDSPSEEAANLMEHGTLTLDLSDDQGSKIGLGKENTPPPDYDAVRASQPHVPAPRRHRAPLSPEVMDDGQRTPLGELDVPSSGDDELEPEGKKVDAIETKEKKLETVEEFTIWED
ncbi:hypothetical protein K470DRAFT_278427 [Piedraia hortae CBS 480.64]|uniref:Uncharacterized protein n=1 Tax=Piedraia hortae CBS 480.64 TaxID=1314780 RepID=A0A6A7BV56_9PEZI|nr:hypothetical protein K470DRAFT_278427 [Piedraia hortae CBS 480.64]